MKQKSIENLSETNHRNLDLFVYITDTEETINILTAIVKHHSQEFNIQNL